MQIAIYNYDHYGYLTFFDDNDNEMGSICVSPEVMEFMTENEDEMQEVFEAMQSYAQPTITESIDAITA